MSDVDGFETLCRREFPRLVGALSLYCGDPVVAEELAQEALLRACRGRARLVQIQAPGAWLHRVAINLANSHYRRGRAERRAAVRQASNGSTVHHDPDSGDAVAIRVAVAALPTRQREALVLRYYLDWPAEEVGEALGISAGAVRQLTRRAMTTLRAEFLLDPESDEVTHGA